jgi:hypothetical protein
MFHNPDMGREKSDICVDPKKKKQQNKGYEDTGDRYKR